MKKLNIILTILLVSFILGVNGQKVDNDTLIKKIDLSLTQFFIDKGILNADEVDINKLDINIHYVLLLK